MKGERRRFPFGKRRRFLSQIGTAEQVIHRTAETIRNFINGVGFWNPRPAHPFGKERRLDSPEKGKLSSVENRDFHQRLQPLGNRRARIGGNIVGLLGTAEQIIDGNIERIGNFDYVFCGWAIRAVQPTCNTPLSTADLFCKSGNVYIVDVNIKLYKFQKFRIKIFHNFMIHNSHICAYIISHKYVQVKHFAQICAIILIRGIILC